MPSLPWIGYIIIEQRLTFISMIAPIRMLYSLASECALGLKSYHTLVTTPSSNKIHHYTMNDNEHKGKHKHFCCLEFEITKT
jgi:hypothetical protein